MSESAVTFDHQGLTLVDTFAEAFPIRGTRLIITAINERWAHIAAEQMCGYATSVIACDAEAGIEKTLTPEETPDGRPGVSVLVFAFSSIKLAAAVSNRVGQCVLTCPTTACYNGLESEESIPVGHQLRYFGDGYQISKHIGGRRFWRIPVMDGEFLCDDQMGCIKAIAGGNLLICGDSVENALAAADAVSAAMQQVNDVILPFPGGIVRSGSKVGSKYPKLMASTNDPYCPTLRGQTTSVIPKETQAVYEIVIDGLSFDSIKHAMKIGIDVLIAAPGIQLVSAGNYGGKLGEHHFHLKDCID